MILHKYYKFIYTDYLKNKTTLYNVAYRKIISLYIFEGQEI